MSNVIMKLDGEITIKVLILIDESAPGDVISRCQTEAWRSHFYTLEGTEEIVEHWTFNAVINGVRDVRELEGWGDLEPGMVRLEVQR